MTDTNYLEELVTDVSKAVKEDKLNFVSLMPNAPPYPSDLVKYIGEIIKDKNKHPDQIRREVVLAGSGIYIKIARAYALRKGPEDRKKVEEYIGKAERESNAYNVLWSTEISSIREILKNGKK